MTNAGLDVFCRYCGESYHATNELFDGRRAATGDMFVLKEPYLSAAWSDFPKDDAVEFGGLTCPGCGAEYSDEDGEVVLVTT